MNNCSDGINEAQLKIFDQYINAIPNIDDGNNRKLCLEFFNKFKNTLNKNDPILKCDSTITFPSNVDNYCTVDDSSGALFVDYQINIPNDLVDIRKATPRHVAIELKINESKKDSEKIQIYNTWLGKDKKILPKKFLQWADSNLTRTINLLKNDSLQVLIVNKGSPPLFLRVKDGTSLFKIYIVFGLKFSMWDFTINDDKVFIDNWVATPSAVDEQNWQYSFVKNEDMKFANLNRLNNTIKLMKRIRDKNNAPYLSNYHIKSIFLWETDKQDKTFWNKNGGFLLWHMLCQLRDALKLNKIIFYWDTSQNLLINIKANQLEDGYKKIDKIIDLIGNFCKNNTPEQLYVILLNDEELKTKKDILNKKKSTSDIDTIKSPAVVTKNPSNNNIMTSPDELNESRYKPLQQYLNIIHSNYNRPNEQVSRDYKKSYRDFSDNFRKFIYNNDPILGKYHKIQHTGSVSDGLSIGTTIKEFDLDLMLALPKNMTNINLSNPGFVSIQLDTSKITDPINLKIFKNWIDEDNYIIPDKFRAWLESVLTKTMKTIEDDKYGAVVSGDHRYRVKMSKSGPAFTMDVQKLDSDVKFLVDFVFTLEFQNWPFNVTSKGVTVKNWLAVPKTPPNNVPKWSRSWRYSLTSAEKHKFADTNNLRIVLKLMKKLRDVSNMPYLASYFIKTLFLWEIDNQKKTFWNSNIGYILIIMLMKLRDAFKAGEILFYWDPLSNLLDRITKNQIEDGYKKVNLIIFEIENICDGKVPEKIETLFILPGEKPNN